MLAGVLENSYNLKIVTSCTINMFDVSTLHSNSLLSSLFADPLLEKVTPKTVYFEPKYLGYNSVSVAFQREQNFIWKCREIRDFLRTILKLFLSQD